MTQEANQVTSYISALDDAADRIEQASQLSAYLTIFHLNVVECNWEVAYDG